MLCCVVQEEDAQFAIVFAAMGVNMETAHFFKQVSERVCWTTWPGFWHYGCWHKGMIVHCAAGGIQWPQSYTTTCRPVATQLH